MSWYKINVTWTMRGCNTEWFQCETEQEAHELAEAMAESLAAGVVAPDTGTAGITAIGAVTAHKVKT